VKVDDGLDLEFIINQADMAADHDWRELLHPLWPVLVKHGADLRIAR